ncbi:hypothetical protein [Gudongella sp. DL1XJH-153]|uniref:hypothetical protein n=1 Tax=Gudongella sp. DL1XJH-153 TaxID=3409804 RepID=UPI003BB644A3
MIEKEDKILDIVSDYPQTEEIFKPYDEIVGKCVMCNHLFETVEEFSEMYDLNMEELLKNLNRNK